MKLHELDDFYYQEQIFSELECDEILKQLNNLEDSTFPVVMDNKFVEVGCSLKSQFLEYNESTKWIHEKIKLFVNKHVECEWTNNPLGVFRKYSKDDFFIKHRDNIYKSIDEKRYVTVSIQLSDETSYEGGNIIINDNTSLSRSKGVAFLWGTNVPHEVTKIKSGFRTSLVFFISNKEVEHIKSIL